MSRAKNKFIVQITKEYHNINISSLYLHIFRNIQYLDVLMIEMELFIIFTLSIS